MLPKQYRLPLRKELFRIRKESKLFQGELFSLLVSKNINHLPTKFGFIVSTKIHKKATKRNRVRRLLSEAIYSLLPKINPNYEVIFLTKKAIIDKKLEEIKNETENMFRLTKIIR